MSFTARASWDQIWNSVQFMWWCLIFQEDIFLIKIEEYQIFCTSFIVDQDKGRWKNFIFSYSISEDFSVGQMSPTDHSFIDFFSSIYASFLHLRGFQFFWFSPKGCDTIFSLFSCYEQPVVFLLRHSLYYSHIFVYCLSFHM